MNLLHAISDDNDSTIIFCIMKQQLTITHDYTLLTPSMQTMENPVRTNKIPRQIPEQSIYTQPLPGSVMGGVLPFGCIFIQLFFILNSIWSSQTYYMFGFLFLVFVILCITCSETTILLCYFHLCAEVSGGGAEIRRCQSFGRYRYHYVEV